jgi:predicted Zn-dependent protease
VLVGAQVLLGDASALVTLGGELGALAIQQGYSRAQESDADAVGVAMMRTAGFDPEGLAGFFAALAKIPGSEMPVGLSWLSTHPDHASRIAHVRRLAGEGSFTAQPLESEFAAVKAVVLALEHDSLDQQETPVPRSPQ